MDRLLRCIIILSILFGGALMGPAQAQAQGCQQLLPDGLYEGTLSADMTITGYADGILAQQFTFNDTSELSLTINCTVTTATQTLHVHRTVKLYPEQPPEPCDYTVAFSNGSGSVVMGSNGYPRIDISWAPGITGPNDCIGPSTGPSTTWRFSLSGPPQGRTLSGDFRYTGDGLSDYEEMAELFRSQGFEVTLTKGWTLTRRPQPTVQGISAALRQFFLAGIAVTNRYTAVIDWEDAGPGVARFLLGDQAPKDMAVNGNTATFDLPLASVAGSGDFPIRVEAELDGRVDQLDGVEPLTLVPVPAWANRFNLQAQVQGDHVRYSGGFTLPEKPLDAHVILPAAIPYVGGTWGLLPTQLKLVLAANSLGTRETGGLSAQGGFGLGKQIYALSASGNIYGKITREALQFESDELVLSTPRIAYREQVGLISVIPGASELFKLKVIGDALQAANSALGVTAEVHGSMTARGRLGIVGESLALTEGSYEAALGVAASGGVNLPPVVWLTVSGGGDGSLRMQFVPQTKLVDCRVLLSFGASAGALGYSAVNVRKDWSVYTCTVGSGQIVVAAAEPEPATLALETRYGSAGPRLSEDSVAQVEATNGLTETVLVENASLQAQPVLATGPNGRMALVWNSVSDRGAADVVSLRLFDGAAWADPITVSLPDRPSFTPSAAFAANGNLLVTWAEAQNAPDPNELSEAFAHSLEIAWAEVAPAMGGVVSRGLVTTDNVMDFAPRLSTAGNGSPWLIWQHSPAANLVGSSTAPNAWYASAWTGSGWREPETVGQNGVGTLFWDVAAVDEDRVWLAADIDTDGNFSTATDREIYLYERTAAGWSAPRRLTTDAVIDSSPLLAVNAGGQPLLAWRHGQSVLGLDGNLNTAQPQVWFAEEDGVSPMLGAGRLLVDANGARSLLWADSTELGQDIWLSRFDPVSQSWSQPMPLFESADQRRSLSSSLLANGDIVLGLAATPVISETVTFEGGGTAEVPALGNAARLLVARIPAGYESIPANESIFLPMLSR